MKTRLLYVCDSLALGGAERVLIDGLRALDYSRFDVRLWMIRDRNDFVSYTNALPIQIQTLGLASTTPRSLHDVIRVGQLWRDVRTFHPHVIHTQGQDADLLGQIMGRLAGVPGVITTLHLPDIFRFSPHKASLRYRVKLILEDWAIGACACVIAISESMRDYIIEQRGVAPRKIVLIPNAVPAVGNGKERKDTAPTVGFVGRLSLQKNLFTALHAFARVRVAIPEVRFLLVGDGPLRTALEAYVDTLGIRSAVQFAGAQTNGSQWLSLMDVLILPSFAEGLPLIILEAMMAGVPVISSNVGAISEVIEHGSTGYIIDAPDQETYSMAAARNDGAAIVDAHQSACLEEALRALLCNAPLRQRIASEARRMLAHERSFERNVQMLQSTYLRVAGRLYGGLCEPESGI